MNHRPRYLYCSEPDLCCETYNPLAVQCAECGQDWPCEVKRSHHTPARVAAIERWAKGRTFREAKG